VTLMTSNVSGENGELSPRTLRAYAGDWALFADWCSTIGNWELPAEPGTITRFLSDCPAAPATQRRRVAAIDYRHAAAGHPRPGESAAVRTVLGRPVGTDPPAPPGMTDQVATALRGLPSHGWTQGMFGRRDRCLLVLSQLAGVPYKHLAALTAGDITLIDGTAIITSSADTWTVKPDGNPILCGSCAVVRWLRVLDVAVTKISTAAVADAVGHAKTVTAESPHLCRSTRTIDAATRPVALLPPINQWGALPFPHPRLTPHSHSRRTRDLLAGELVAHRTLPIPSDQPPQNTATPRGVEPAGSVYSKASAEQAWSKRRDELHRLADVGDVLSDIDQQIAVLQQRVNALLDGEVS
jgi:hypothetical protein